VKGQYRGYTDESGVARGSLTETFAAVRLDIDSWRWAGVPFYVRAGKALAENATEAVVELKDPPRLLFDEIPGPPPERNLIRFRLGNDDGVSITLQAKTPGDQLDSQTVDLSVDFAAALGERKDAYERLLGDAIAGNPRRFARQDIVEEAWRIVQPVLDLPSAVHVYDRGSWGPPQAYALLEHGTYWHDPARR
jgi:glucose-6-phosphate 1-dehydrogenase